MENRLIYIAKISEKINDGDYYKKSSYFDRTDCIYRFEGDEYKNISKCYHKNAPFEKEGNDIVLLSEKYRYFGKNSEKIDSTKYPLLCKILPNLKQGHRNNHEENLRVEIENLIRETFEKVQLANVEPYHTANCDYDCSAMEDDKFVQC